MAEAAAGVFCLLLEGVLEVVDQWGQGKVYLFPAFVC